MKMRLSGVKSEKERLGRQCSRITTMRRHIKGKNHNQIFLRKKRVRSKIHGTARRPRLSVHRSLRYITAQLIDDEKGYTLASAGSVLTAKGREKIKTKTDQARLIGEQIAKKALHLGIKSVIFDRGAYAYHGRVKAVAEGARETGLQF